jgi:hypothetical protein
MVSKIPEDFGLQALLLMELARVMGKQPELSLRIPPSPALPTLEEMPTREEHLAFVDLLLRDEGRRNTVLRVTRFEVHSRYAGMSRETHPALHDLAMLLARRATCEEDQEFQRALDDRFVAYLTAIRPMYS